MNFCFLVLSRYFTKSSQGKRQRQEIGTVSTGSIAGVYNGPLRFAVQCVYWLFYTLRFYNIDLNMMGWLWLYELLLAIWKMFAKLTSCIFTQKQFKHSQMKKQFYTLLNHSTSQGTYTLKLLLFFLEKFVQSVPRYLLRK